jgi:hypothetical protein
MILQFRAAIKLLHQEHMKFPDSFEEFQQMCGGWHGPISRLPEPLEPEPGLSFIGRMRWHMRECLRPKSESERLAIRLAKLRKQ